MGLGLVITVLILRSILSCLPKLEFPFHEYMALWALSEETSRGAISTMAIWSSL